MVRSVTVAVPDPFALIVMVDVLRLVLGMLLVCGVVVVVSVIVPEKL